MKVAVIGSRTLTAINIGEYLPNGTTTIISGGAKGIDTLAAEYAKNHNVAIVEFKPDYKQYGRGATFIRNRQIIDFCDVVVALWDGVSKGTKYSIDYAHKTGKEVQLYEIQKGSC